MKKNNLKKFILENNTSFYSLYYTEYPSKEVEQMRDGDKKEEKLEIEQIKYKNLLSDFLRMTSSMN